MSVFPWPMLPVLQPPEDSVVGGKRRTRNEF
jgi:hypothetical protein